MLFKAIFFYFIFVTSLVQAMPNRSGWAKNRKSPGVPSRTSCGDIELDNKSILSLGNQGKIISSLQHFSESDVVSVPSLVPVEKEKLKEDRRLLDPESDTESSDDALTNISSVASAIVLDQQPSLELVSSKKDAEEELIRSFITEAGIKVVEHDSSQPLTVSPADSEEEKDTEEVKILNAASTQFPEPKSPQISTEKKGWDYLVEIKDSFGSYFAGIFALAQIPTLSGLAVKAYFKELPRDTPRTKQEHIKACGQKFVSMVAAVFKNPKLSYRQYPLFTTTFMSMATIDIILVAHACGLF